MSENEQNDVLERDYPELVGKRIKWKNLSLEHDGVVVGCDYHIGITIVNAYDKDDYLMCLHGPLSPRARAQKREGMLFDGKMHKSFFTACIKSIESGFLDCESTSLGVVSDLQLGEDPSSSSCPFGA